MTARPRSLVLAALLLPLLVAGCQSGPGTSPEAPPRSSEDAPPTEADAAGDRSSADAGFRELLQQMGVRYLPEEQRLEVDGFVNMQQGLVELFACAPGGKTHEAVVVLDCVPSGLHAGLMALGLRPGTPAGFDEEGNPVRPSGPGVVVEVRWRAEDGGEHRARAEDWVWDEKAEGPMPHVAWLFTGSFLQSFGDDPDEGTYAADMGKSLVTTYYDAGTVLENPLPDGGDDTVYFANERAVPPVGTPVTAIFRAAEEQ